MKTNKSIFLRGCKQNNLKNIDIDIPLEKITAVTGISGSGKSSLVQDIIHAEGQRRLLELVSVAHKPIFTQIPHPEAELIENLPPTLMPSTSYKSLIRSTIASYTPLFFYLLNIFSHEAALYSPATGEPLSATSADAIEPQLKLTEGDKIAILAPFPELKSPSQSLLDTLIESGFIRYRVNGQILRADEQGFPKPKSSDKWEVVIDRIKWKTTQSQRLCSSIETAYKISQGFVYILNLETDTLKLFSEDYYCPSLNRTFEKLSSHSFKGHQCKETCIECLGSGQIIHLNDKKKLKKLERKADITKVENILKTHKNDSAAITKLLSKDKRLCSLLIDNGSLIVETCSLCLGSGYAEHILHFKWQGMSFWHLQNITIGELSTLLEDFKKSSNIGPVAKEMIPQLHNYLQSLIKFGLSHLKLQQPISTLSDGEFEKLHLSKLFIKPFKGMLYLFDEPSKCFHPKDLPLLIETFKTLTQQGNTVVFIDHSKELIASAHHIIEIGPGSGVHGGGLTFSGPSKKFTSCPNSITAPWLRKEKQFPTIKITASTDSIPLNYSSTSFFQPKKHAIPTANLIAIVGLNGTGKSRFLKEVIVPSFKQNNAFKGSTILFDNPKGPQQKRSTPLTALQLFTSIRQIFAHTLYAKSKGWAASYFSLQKEGARCDYCEGEGLIHRNLELLPDLTSTCPKCKGRRYKLQALNSLWKGKSIADVLAMRFSEALDFFASHRKLYESFKIVAELGMDYLTLGQPLNTLSSGELQRLKLISDLVTYREHPSAYIFDEPSRGLHFQDEELLLKILYQLVESGNTIVYATHHPALIKAASYVIELDFDADISKRKVASSSKKSTFIKSESATAKYLH